MKSEGAWSKGVSSEAEDCMVQVRGTSTGACKESGRRYAPGALRQSRSPKRNGDNSRGGKRSEADGAVTKTPLQLLDEAIYPGYHNLHSLFR